MKICELMKNHIKNYIKIMGLAAVPFGTAQVHGNTEYKIEVKKKETDKVRHFSIGVKCFSEKKCFLRPEVIEIDWPKSNDAVPVRVSKHDAKSIFRFCDVVTKQNAALGYDHKKLVRGSVHVLSFLVRKFPFKSNEPFEEWLRCDLVFNPHPVGKQEEALLVVKVFGRETFSVSILSDIPTAPQGKEDFFCNQPSLSF